MVDITIVGNWHTNNVESNEWTVDEMGIDRMQSANTAGKIDWYKRSKLPNCALFCFVRAIIWVYVCTGHKKPRQQITSPKMQYIHEKTMGVGEEGRRQWRREGGKDDTIIKNFSAQLIWMLMNSVVCYAGTGQHGIWEFDVCAQSVTNTCTHAIQKKPNKKKKSSRERKMLKMSMQQIICNGNRQI